MQQRVQFVVSLIVCAITSAASGQTDPPLEQEPRDFLFLAKHGVLMEGGPALINGNIGVNDPDGLLKVGAKNTINGHVIAHRIIFGTGSKITTCEFNVASGVDPHTVCTTIISPVNPPLPIVAWPPFPVPPGPRVRQHSAGPEGARRHDDAPSRRVLSGSSGRPWRHAHAR